MSSGVRIVLHGSQARSMHSPISSTRRAEANGTQEAQEAVAVGAVCDRAFLPAVIEKRAVMDRAYSSEVKSEACLEAPGRSFGHALAANQAKVIVAVQREICPKVTSGAGCETWIIGRRVIQHILRVDAEFQTLVLGDSNCLAERCIEEPESRTFHGVQR